MRALGVLVTSLIRVLAHALGVVIGSLTLLLDHWKALLGVCFASAAASAVIVSFGVGLGGLGLAVLLSGGFQSGLSMIGLGGLASLLAQIVLLVFATGLGTTYAARRCEDPDLAFGAAVAQSVRRLPVGLGAGLAAAILTLAALVATGLLVGSLLPGFVRLGRGGAHSLAGMGVDLLAALPALYIFLGFATALPVAFLERRGVGESIRTAWQMMKGQRTRIFFVFLLAAVVGWFVSFGADAALTWILFRVTLPLWMLTGTAWLTQNVLAAVLQAWAIAIGTLIYLSLREETSAEA